MALPEYELYAIRYAMRDAQRRDHFIGGDPHDAPMPMDSEQAFEIAFLLVSLVAFAAEPGCTAIGFPVEAGCATAALEPIRTTNAVIINVFENLIVTSPG
jgi:hypothetical protein